MESQIKELKKGNDQLSVTPTIIIKSVGKASTSFLPLFPPSLTQCWAKLYMFVPVIVLLYPNIEYEGGGGGGGWGIFSKRERRTLFSGFNG